MASKFLISSTNHQWGMKKSPTDGSFTLYKSLPMDKTNNMIKNFIKMKPDLSGVRTYREPADLAEVQGWKR
ncbi:hypothetical protein GCM10008986_29760 [Salinibacillus aidingensis]|uniref:Uncharacterized protein n=1 Tax=Salinibacillus aidingensis TaxID=237684 RepID=A0ABN1BM02_9BACI